MFSVFRLQEQDIVGELREEGAENNAQMRVD